MLKHNNCYVTLEMHYNDGCHLSYIIKVGYEFRFLATGQAS